MGFWEVFITLVIFEVDLVSVTDVVGVVGQPRATPHKLEVKLPLEIVKAFEHSPESFDTFMLLSAALRSNEKSEDLHCIE